MKRNIVLALVIGALAANLPFWTWDGAVRIAGALALGVVSLVGLIKFDGGGEDDQATDGGTGDACPGVGQGRPEPRGDA